MTRNPTHPNHPTRPIIAKWCIWSIKHQTWLAGRLRIYIWGATAVVAFLMFAGVIPLKESLLALFFSGVAIATIIWLMIRMRRSWLLNIEAPELRQQALTAMMDYLYEIDQAVPVSPQCGSISGSDSRKHAGCAHSR